MMATGGGTMLVILVTKRKEIKGTTDQDFFADGGKASILLPQ